MQTVGAFVKAARRVHPFLQYTKTSDTLWSRYIFKFCQEYRQLPSFKMKTLVVSLGRQPSADVWVLGESLQVNAWDMRFLLMSRFSTGVSIYPISNGILNCPFFRYGDYRAGLSSVFSTFTQPTWDSSTGGRSQHCQSMHWL